MHGWIFILRQLTRSISDHIGKYRSVNYRMKHKNVYSRVNLEVISVNLIYMISVAFPSAFILFDFWNIIPEVASIRLAIILLHRVSVSFLCALMALPLDGNPLMCTMQPYLHNAHQHLLTPFQHLLWNPCGLLPTAAWSAKLHSLCQSNEHSQHLRP